MNPEAPDGIDEMAALAHLNRRIEDLRAFEREYRLMLRIDLEDRAASLDSGDGALPLRSAVRRIAEAPEVFLVGEFSALPERQRTRILAALLSVPVPEAAP